MIYRFLVRGGLAAAVAALNEVPLARELVFETDTGKFKLGDGVTAYNALPYYRAGMVPIVDAGGLIAATEVEGALQELATAIALRATTAYVDAAIAGLRWKQPCRVATTAAISIATGLENGDTIDGVVLATGDRVLVKDQASGDQNGIYVVVASGAAPRATDADSSAEIVSASVYVSEGTANADKQFVCTTNAPITVGVTTITFVEFSSGSAYTDEQVRDVVAAMVAAGTHTGITITYNDAGDSLSFTVTGGGGGSAISSWQSQATTITGVTSNPTKGTIVRDKIYWRRVGDSMEVRIDYRQSTAGAAGSGVYLFTVPDGKTIDSTKCHISTSGDTEASVGGGQIGDQATYARMFRVQPHSTTKVRFNDTTAGNIGSANLPMTQTQWTVSATFVVPILEWA